MLVRICLTVLLLCSFSLFAQTVPITAPGEIFWSQPLETLAPGVKDMRYVGLLGGNLYFIQTLNRIDKKSKGNETYALVVFSRELKHLTTHPFTPAWPEDMEFGAEHTFTLAEGKLNMVAGGMIKSRLAKVLLSGSLDLKSPAATMPLKEIASLALDKSETFFLTYPHYTTTLVSPDSSKVCLIARQYGLFLILNGTMEVVLAKTNPKISDAINRSGKKEICLGVTGTQLQSQDVTDHGPSALLDNNGNYYTTATLQGPSGKIPALIRLEELGSRSSLVELPVVDPAGTYDYFAAMHHSGGGVVVAGYHTSKEDVATVWYALQAPDKPLTNKVVSVPFTGPLMEQMTKRLNPVSVHKLGSPFHFARPTAAFTEATGELTIAFQQEYVLRQESSHFYRMVPFEGSIIFCTFAAGGAAHISRCTSVNHYCAHFEGMSTNIVAGKNDQYLVIFSGVDKQFTHPATFSALQDYHILTINPLMTGTALVANGKEPLIRAGKTHEAVSVYAMGGAWTLPGDQALVLGRSVKSDVVRLALIGLPK